MLLEPQDFWGPRSPVNFLRTDGRFVYVLNGWVDLAFEDGRTERVAAGAAMAIPSGMVHNELACSDDFEALEVVAPAQMETVPCDAPANA